MVTLESVLRTNNKTQIDNFFKFITLNNGEFLKVQFNETLNKGIYHSSTFLIFNVILDRLGINFNLIEIPMTLWFWILIIVAMSYIIYKKNRNFKLNLYVFLYVSLIFGYALVLLYWGYSNRLINEDLTLETSWQRHIGSLIFPMIIFLLIKFLNHYNKYKILFILTAFSLSITLPNTIRNFLPFEQIYKIDTWKSKIDQRAKVKILSNRITRTLPQGSSIIFAFNNPDPYLMPLLKYELIENWAAALSHSSTVRYLQLRDFNDKNKKLFIMINKNFDEKLIDYQLGVYKKDNNFKFKLNKKLEYIINDYKFYKLTKSFEN